MMRPLLGAIGFALAVLIICCALAVCMAQPRAHAQLHNAYWPFTVETAVLDR